MPAYLARTGLAVFAMLFAMTFLTEHIAAGDAQVAATSAIDLPQLHEIATTRIEGSDVLLTVAGFETVPENDVVVLASWYGPGFYGNRTACGQTFTPEILGVAHLTLACGTSLTLSHGSRSVTVTVIDRGPYIAGRAVDLSMATKLALECSDLCTLRMQIAH
jgi:rare lipoprotein A (peptidoglycan hydrolase)